MRAPGDQSEGRLTACIPNKTPHSGGFSDGNVLLLPVLEADSPGSRCGQVWFLLESLCLACTQPPSRCVLSGLCHPGVCVRSISSCKASSQTRWGPTLTASFQRNPPFKDLISKHTPILRYWGLGLPHMNLAGGGDTISQQKRARLRHRMARQQLAIHSLLLAPKMCWVWWCPERRGPQCRLCGWRADSGHLEKSEMGHVWQQPAWPSGHSRSGLFPLQPAWRGPSVETRR